MIFKFYWLRVSPWKKAGRTREEEVQLKAISLKLGKNAANDYAKILGQNILFPSS